MLHQHQVEFSAVTHSRNLTYTFHHNLFIPPPTIIFPSSILGILERQKDIMPVTIRPETPADHEAIHSLTAIAFAKSTAREAFIVDDLRAASALTLSLVATDSSSSSSSSHDIIGHVAFSPVTITPTPAKTWLGLGPISVAPERQRQGVGRMLIEASLERLRDMDGVQGCVLLGNPELYNKFGFFAGRGLTLEGVPPHYFMSVVLDGGEYPQGVVKFHETFDQSLKEADTKSH
ncbi:hypothetical protein PWT90_10049 [Aphanocladium album]|nr:hypothetical protein PWT90_10049 [Aphanocladium album]